MKSSHEAKAERMRCCRRSDGGERGGRRREGGGIEGNRTTDEVQTDEGKEKEKRD